MLEQKQTIILTALAASFIIGTIIYKYKHLVTKKTINNDSDIDTKKED